ncbi:MAG: adenylate/guanylate cyclase domain-containing protein [Labilithrix sp.]|nr:adenylate/guanylate cyclase domain-containing protein [Labilithrix sp.]
MSSDPPPPTYRPSTAPRAPSISPPEPEPEEAEEAETPSEDPEPRATLVPGAADVDPRETFERHLVREILGAERFRALLLFLIPTIALFALVIASGVYPEKLASVLHGNFDRAPIGLFLIVVAGFELYVLVWIRGLLRRGERPGAARRYGHAFVETSLPTAVILYYSWMDGPIGALLMPSAFVYSIFILLSTLGLDFFLCTFTGLVAAAEYGAIAFFWGTNDTRVAEPALSSLPHHTAKALVLLVSGVAAGFVARRLRKSFTSAIESVGERARILGVFGQHVSPEVVDRLVTGKAEVKSELRSVCVMFLDIRNFTAFAESRSPDEVVDYLNVVFESTIEAIVSRHGIVNKFLGDGFMAVFGAPIIEDDASRAAVDAALDIIERVERLVAEGKIPPTTVGIGLHTGEAVVGNIGSAQRKEYTVIGDAVNVASRIEALNKQLGSRVLASDETWSASGRDDIEAIAHEPVQVRGRQKPVRIWQLA